jgi:hypothetical protein
MRTAEDFGGSTSLRPGGSTTPRGSSPTITIVPVVPDYVFTRLSPDDAKAWIARGIGRRDSEELLRARRHDDNALDPQGVLWPVPTSDDA